MSDVPFLFLDPWNMAVSSTLPVTWMQLTRTSSQLYTHSPQQNTELSSTPTTTRTISTIMWLQQTGASILCSRTPAGDSGTRHPWWRSRRTVILRTSSWTALVYFLDLEEHGLAWTKILTLQVDRYFCLFLNIYSWMKILFTFKYK